MISSPGRLLYLFYHRPLANLRRCINEGGPLQQRRTQRGEQEMILAAQSLSLPAGLGPAIELHLLSGRRFWHQTAFCLWTFARHSARTVEPVIYDDGTLEEPHRSHLLRLFPSTRFVSPEESRARLASLLPASRYPRLNERWHNYVNIRKLIDPHLGAQGWKLVLDSDLLFFREPRFLLNWIDAPDRPLHAVDCETSYGYPLSLLDQLAAAPLAPLVNVGLCGLRSESIDWEKLEYWCRELTSRHGTHYYLEQALVAMLVAGRETSVAPREDYVTMPVPPEISTRRAVMHHYVAFSKRGYFRENWRAALLSEAKD